MRLILVCLLLAAVLGVLLPVDAIVAVFGGIALVAALGLGLVAAARTMEELIRRA